MHDLADFAGLNVAHLVVDDAGLDVEHGRPQEPGLRS